MGITRNVPRANRSATGAPTVNDDVDLGYVVGSIWNDVTNDISYECLDNTDGGAVWQKRIKGPTTSTDDAIVRFDGTDGDTVQDADTTLSDAEELTGPGTLTLTPDEITATSEGVAASITTLNTEVTTNGDTDLDDVTLANGTSGQVKNIYCVVETAGGDTWKITPATMAGGSQITFATVGEGCTLVYADSEGWVVVANNGGTIS